MKEGGTNSQDLQIKMSNGDDSETSANVKVLGCG